MKKYLDLCTKILNEGVKKADRTGSGTISYFGVQTRYDLRKGFPLITTKKMYTRAVIEELLWFIRGETNIHSLVKNKVRIWNEWPYQRYKKSHYYRGETMTEFCEKILNDGKFANLWGDLGPIYGKQWRNFNNCHVDQLQNVINEIITNPTSRRLIVCAWNPLQIDKMLLPPCHCFFQFYVNNGFLDLQLYQRSADIFLGVPFNIASYSILLMMVAKICNLTPRYFIHTLGDAHIYSDHIELIKKQLMRKPYDLPSLKIHGNQKTINDFKYSDFEICNYKSHDKISGKVSV